MASKPHPDPAKPWDPDPGDETFGNHCMWAPRTCVFNVHVHPECVHTCIFVYTVHSLPYQDSFASQFSTNSIYFEPLTPLTLVESSRGTQEVQSSSSIVGLPPLVNLQFMPDVRTFTHKNIALGATWFTEKMLLFGAGWGKTRNRLLYIYEYVAHICFLF